MRLRPLPAARVANTLPGALLAATGVVLWFTLECATWRWPVGAAAVALGLLLGLRGLRTEVVCDSGGIRVRGLLRTRVVPRKAVLEVTDWPALRWTGDEGRRRWTPLVMFATTARTLRPVRHHHEEQVRRLRRWVHRRP